MYSLQLDITKTVCFTGHRPDKLGGYHTVEYGLTAARVAERTECLIRLFISQGYTNFICGGAQGYDTVAAREVWKFRQTNKDIKLIIAVPFRGQEARWPQSAQRTYNAMLQAADEVVVLSETSDNAAHKMQQRNEWMVNNSSWVIACWDGSSGGTKNCIEYAKSQNKEVLKFSPDDFEK